GVVRSEGDVGRYLAAVALDQRGHVVRAFAVDPLDAGEHALVIAGAIVEFRGGDDGRDAGVADHARGHVAVQALQADQHPGAGIVQHRLELPGPVHRVDRDRDAAHLPRGEHADDELGHVLQVQDDPVAPADAQVAQGDGERAGQLVELARGDPAAEVADDVAVRVPAYRRTEHGQGVGKLQADLGRLVRVVQAQPGLLVINRHNPINLPPAAAW